MNLVHRKVRGTNLPPFLARSAGEEGGLAGEGEGNQPSPLPRPAWARKGLGGKVRGTNHPPFLARSAGEEGGLGGKVRESGYALKRQPTLPR